MRDTGRRKRRSPRRDHCSTFSKELRAWLEEAVSLTSVRVSKVQRAESRRRMETKEKTIGKGKDGIFCKL